jgi:predicted O-methyltransferase YrrM
VASVVDAVLQEKLTYLTPPDLAALARLVLHTERLGLDGLVIEAGTALGGSAIAMAAAKSAERPMKVYDVFGMIPEPSERDGASVQKRYEDISAGRSQGLGGDTYYGYREDLLAEVTASFTRHGVEPGAHHVELVKGLFQDTIDLDEPVALAHLDGDWYESTMVCLERIAPLLVPGGRLVLDDYYFWAGCREATDDYFAGRAGFRLEYRAKVHVVREGAALTA